MLVNSLKNEEKSAFFSPVCDSHLHLVQCGSFESLENFKEKLSAGNFSFANYYCASCFHSVSEWESFEKLDLSGLNVKKAFGFHPQNPDFIKDDGKFFLQKLLEEGKIDAIGEIGFDFFTEEFKSNIDNQEKAFLIELNFARDFNKPLVIHERKALNMIYKYSSELKKLPSVLFHSFFYGFYEAESLLKKGINGYFSFGKTLLNNKKKALECVKNLPLDRILLETDAPYQTLKDEKFTPLSDIFKVYKTAMEIRSVQENRQEEFLLQLKENFFNLYGD